MKPSMPCAGSKTVTSNPFAASSSRNRLLALPSALKKDTPALRLSKGQNSTRGYLSGVSGRTPLSSLTSVTERSAQILLHSANNGCPTCRPASSARGISRPASRFSGRRSAALRARIRVTASASRSSVRIPRRSPSVMNPISSSRSLVKRNISHPAAMLIGTSLSRGINAVTPAIVEESVTISPLNPSCSRSSLVTSS